MARPANVSAVPVTAEATKRQLDFGSFDPNYSVFVSEGLAYNPATGDLERVIQTDKNWAEFVSTDTNNNPVYQGWAPVGSNASAAVWRIKKLGWDASSNFVSSQWADSNDEFDNVWTSVSALTYG